MATAQLPGARLTSWARIDGQPCPTKTEDIARWMKQGRIMFPEAVVEGTDAASEAFCSVFLGNSLVGKLLVRVTPAS